MPEPGPRKRLARNPAKAVQAPIVQIPAVQKASREQEKGRGQEKSRIKKPTLDRTVQAANLEEDQPSEKAESP